MKLSMFEMMRVWAALTGILLAFAYFGALEFGYGSIEIVAMLVTAIGGFEMMLFAQDVAISRRRKRKHG